MMSTKTAYEVVMPKLGLIMTEAMLVEWHKEDQEWVEHGEDLFSLESDKTLVVIEAPETGYLQILVPAGDMVPVMTPVALISEEKDGQMLAGPVSGIQDVIDETKSEKTSPVERRNSAVDGSIRATPKARKKAREINLNLYGLAGTGPRGMIVSSDLDKIREVDFPIKATPLARRMAEEYGLNLAQLQGTGPGGRISREDIDQAVKKRLSSNLEPRKSPSLPLTGLRGVIAQRLSASWNERPQVTLFEELDATALVKSRSKLNEMNGKISFNSFLIQACARALVEFPDMNVRLTDTELVSLDQVNIGLAVDTKRGLMVPVLQDTDKKTLGTINSELMDLVARTLEGKLLPGEYSDGSFTITNLGAYGTDYFSPIINPPETAILGVGRIAKKPVANDNEVIIQEKMTLSLSFDHRLIDGAPAAKFLHRICELLEDPDQFIKLD